MDRMAEGIWGGRGRRHSVPSTVASRVGGAELVNDHRDGPRGHDRLGDGMGRKRGTRRARLGDLGRQRANRGGVALDLTNLARRRWHENDRELDG